MWCRNRSSAGSALPVKPLQNQAIAACLAVEALGDAAHRGGRGARRARDVQVRGTPAQHRGDLKTLCQIDNLTRAAEIGEQGMRLLRGVQRAECLLEPPNRTRSTSTFSQPIHATPPARRVTSGPHPYGSYSIALDVLSGSFFSSSITPCAARNAAFAADSTVFTTMLPAKLLRRFLVDSSMSPMAVSTILID